MIKKAGILSAWAAGFAIFATAYFYFLFDFFIWSPASWNAMFNSVIRGIKGLAFGASLVAALPIFLAGGYYIWKNQKLPFSIPKLKSKKADEKPAAAPEAETIKYDLPDILPDEIKEPYIRVLTAGQLYKSAADFMKSPRTVSPAPNVEALAPDDHAEAPEAAPAATASIAVAPTAATAAAPSAGTTSDTGGAFMPLPDSFDTDEIDNPEEAAAPMFKDVSF